MRHPRVWFAAAPPGGPRNNPVGYYRAGLGPGPVKRESGKMSRARRLARVSSPSAPARRAHPLILREGKRDGPTPSPTKAGGGKARLFDK